MVREFCVQLWAPSISTWTCWSESQESHEDDGELEHLSCEDKLRELGLFTLANRRLQGDLTVDSST